MCGQRQGCGVAPASFHTPDVDQVSLQCQPWQAAFTSSIWTVVSPLALIVSLWGGTL